MPPEESKDPRFRLDLALQHLAGQLRPQPTLPAHDDNAADGPWDAALLEDAAVQLPAKHCAFRGCAWAGPNDAALALHLGADHAGVLDCVADLLPYCNAVEDRRGTAYNEAIAVA
eukprot:16286482-Heterocapsa_arctica.AAC.1